MTAPLVGVTGRRGNGRLSLGRDGRFANVQFDNHAVDFAWSIAAAGGIPVHLPFEAPAREVVRRLDAVVIAGGQDVDPRRWRGDDHVDPSLATDPRENLSAYDHERDEYEIELVRAALDAGIRLLGVCRGHQILNVALGGTLIPDLPPGDVRHDSPLFAPHGGTPDHEVAFEPGTLAHRLYGPRAVRNSWHHQAIDRCGVGLVVTGRTRDGVIESVEMPMRPVLGVQWHPEWQAGGDPVFAWLTSKNGSADEF
ncbi:gamma-glutamyl-gamma-aminobutyrate hydrolase family protein [Actinomadura spongiicola]|uniref:Gamma-glutamyl-gamma-aminobutyrate hydrolase family protein n=1 Tax=Actinomadura spongiicola TaxID=2303421 RepID=A0A372GQE2_9ACTN|nr:gamma-glutamyl-gamma-aminobutyrate hydrolase family protein [Actinomadura spongiicola]RFS87382.1 gamma-glutamyl-gamma-aminobutyrate hydrolase family protein [Actinomadura spongiicola]